MKPSIRIEYDVDGDYPKVFTEDGKELKGITGIQIETIEANGLVKATLDFDLVELDLKGVVVAKLVGEDEGHEH